MRQRGWWKACGIVVRPDSLLRKCDLLVMFGDGRARCGDQSSPIAPSHTDPPRGRRRRWFAGQPGKRRMKASTTRPAQPAFHPALVENNPVGALCWNEVIAHRAYLVRFAQRKLPDPMRAEDAWHHAVE